jgi:hypothetical protein
VKPAPDATADDRSNTGHSHEPSRTISHQARILAGLTVTLLAFITGAPHAGTPERTRTDVR